MDRFRGRVAIVTGAGPVGHATAARFAREGASVVLADIDPSTVKAAADAIGADGAIAHGVVADVSDENQVITVVNTAVGLFGRLDILHNNVAITEPADGDLTELDFAVWQKTMTVNSGAAMLGCKHAVPAMRESGGGVIINTASVSGLWGDDVRAAYGSSKAAIMTLTKYVATMYGRDNIRCNAVAPSLIMSEKVDELLRGTELLDELAAERLLAWPATPEDIAGVVTWLASDEARGITGQTIVVDSGTTAHRHRHATKQWVARHSASSPGEH
jgi:NAD(P)-dependent dehydrogenase (short-subunit alcohol dehydrogenase family)